MSDAMTSKLADADMQAAPKALLRSAQRAREIARQTNTPLVLMRDGVLVEELLPALPAALVGSQDTRSATLKP